MRRSFVGLLAAILAFTLLSCATSKPAETTTGSELAQHQAPSRPQKPGVVAVEVTGWTATVKSVDYAKKTVVLERDGKTATFDASHAERLNEINPGDVVKVEHIEEIAIYVRKAEDGPAVGEMLTVELAPKNQGPGGIVTDTKQVVANVEAIDYVNRTITLQGPDGGVKTFKVSDAVEKFDQIRKGDQVVLLHTDALLVFITKP